jgi:hypothetical protein
MLLFEGIAFAIGLLIVASGTCFLAVEAIRKTKQSH